MQLLSLSNVTLKEVVRKERLFFVTMDVGIVVEAVVVVAVVAATVVVVMDVGIVVEAAAGIVVEAIVVVVVAVVAAALVVMDVVVDHVVIEVTFYSMAVSWHSKFEVLQCLTPNIINSQLVWFGSFSCSTGPLL